MPLMYLVAIISIAIGGIYAGDAQREVAQAELSEAKNIKGGLMVYATAVASFRAANNGFVGEAPDGALTLPSWFRKDPRLRNRVAPGLSYVYFESSAGELMDLNPFFHSNSTRFAVVRNGAAVSMLLGSVLGPTPGIPEGSIVYAL